MSLEYPPGPPRVQVPGRSSSVSNVGYVAAFGGGVVSFLSPCVLPMVPAYVSMVTGLDLAEVRAGERRHAGRIIRDTSLFVVGFGVVFVVLGLGASAFGGAVFRNQVLLTRLSGLVVVAMAVFLVGSLVLRAPWLYQESPVFTRARHGSVRWRRRSRGSPSGSAGRPASGRSSRCPGGGGVVRSGGQGGRVLCLPIPWVSVSPSS